MIKELSYASDIVMQILPFLRKERWKKNLEESGVEVSPPHNTNDICPSSAHQAEWEVLSLLTCVFLDTSAEDRCRWHLPGCGDCCTSWWPWASPCYSGISCTAGELCTVIISAHTPRHILVSREGPKLFLTISKRGDVSQVFSADLRNILHHEDLPGQLIQEVSCHKWCFTGEHNLLVKVNGKRQKGVIEPKRKPDSEKPKKPLKHLQWSDRFIAWNHRISLT